MPAIEFHPNFIFKSQLLSILVVNESLMKNVACSMWKAVHSVPRILVATAVIFFLCGPLSISKTALADTTAEQSESHGRPYSFEVTLPPLGVIILKPRPSE